MAEFLIRVHDKTNPDSVYLDVKCLKRGDVVDVMPDGHPWSERERTYPFWRIIKVPGLPIDEAEAFLAAEVGVGRMLRMRAFNVQTQGLPPPIQQWMDDDSRAEPSRVLSMAQIRSMKSLKVKLDDPGVIG